MNIVDFFLSLFAKSKSPTNTTTPSKGFRNLIPLYAELGDSVWNDALKIAPSTIVVNPADGPGPAGWSDVKIWSQQIYKLLAAGHQVLYYIDCQTAVRSGNQWKLARKTAPQLLSDKKLYEEYPKASGYFLDDYPSDQVFNEVAVLETSLSGLIVANPGTVPSSNVLSKSLATVFVAHETNGYPKKLPDGKGHALAAIVFGGTTNDTLKKQKWQYGAVYTNKESANPFTTLPNL